MNKKQNHRGASLRKRGKEEKDESSCYVISQNFLALVTRKYLANYFCIKRKMNTTKAIESFIYLIQ